MWKNHEWKATDSGIVSGHEVICEAPIHHLESHKSWDEKAAYLVGLHNNPASLSKEAQIARMSLHAAPSDVKGGGVLVTRYDLHGKQVVEIHTEYYLALEDRADAFEILLSALKNSPHWNWCLGVTTGGKEACDCGKEAALSKARGES